MNPYEVTNILHPTVPVDHRMLESHLHGDELEYSVSRAVFRAICVVEKLLSGSGR